VIAAKKGTCEPVPNNLVTANKISRPRRPDAATATARFYTTEMPTIVPAKTKSNAFRYKYKCKI
jgi:hypothetical protein